MGRAQCLSPSVALGQQQPLLASLKELNRSTNMSADATRCPPATASRTSPHCCRQAVLCALLWVACSMLLHRSFHSMDGPASTITLHMVAPE